MRLFTAFFDKAVQKDLTVSSRNGFHLRPVAKFVSKAKAFKSKVEASFNGNRVNAKGVNSLLNLSLEAGDTFTLTCKGKDAQSALQTLTETFETLMQNDEEIVVIDKEETVYEGESIGGEIIFSGIAIAPVYRYKEKILQKEGLPFEEALSASLEELTALHAHNRVKNNADIYLAQKELLVSLQEDVSDLAALETKIDNACKMLLGSKLEAKISDYKDVLHRVKKQMGEQTEILLPKSDAILLADDLLPSQIEQLGQSHVAAVILKETSLNSHTAILLRGEGIVSLITDTDDLEEGQHIIVDAHAALVIKTPSKKDFEKAEKRLKSDKQKQHNALEKRFENAVTKKGKQIKVLANVTDIRSAQKAKKEGAEGIGLLRTEFLFTQEKPSFDTQAEAYGKIFSMFENVTIRTLDVGGDKALPYIDLDKENNPFLGIRGVRLFLTHPDILEEQLHAMFVAANNKAIRIMFPMVSCVEEFVEAKEFAQKVAKKHQLAIDKILFGMMIEVPSALFLLEAFNEVVDFYSIGTNDLIQYLFAIERTHSKLKTNDLSPAVLAALKLIIEKTDKPLSICGELAANEKAIPTLLEMGMETLSVSVKNIANIKEIIRHV